MDVAPGFVPGSKTAGCDVFPDTFFGPSQKCQLPVMDAARSIRRQMCHPSLVEQLDNDPVRAIFYQMSAIHQDDACPTAPRSAYFCFALLHKFLSAVAGRGRLCRIDQQILYPAQAAPLRERVNPNLAQFESTR